MTENPEELRRHQTNENTSSLLGDSSRYESGNCRAKSLIQKLSSITSLCIVCHDNPDPDCLASALALQDLATEEKIEPVQIVYSGEITHQQNRMMVNFFEIELQQLQDISLDEFDSLAFVDHSEPGRNNPVPEGTQIDIIIDHHPVEHLSAPYLDHQTEVGATTTLLTNYYQELGKTPDERIATALLFGLHRETLDFLRGVTFREHQAACYLCPHADIHTVKRLSETMFTNETLSTIGDAIANRVVRGSNLLSSVKTASEYNSLPLAADYLLKLEGVSTCVVFGIIDRTVHLSARTQNPNLDIGTMMKETFDEEGSAGGHLHMAGGQIPLETIGVENVDTEEIIKNSTQALETRLFKALDEWIDGQPSGTFQPT